jgi:hypothetical protein
MLYPGKDVILLSNELALPLSVILALVTIPGAEQFTKPLTKEGKYDDLKGSCRSP